MFRRYRATVRRTARGRASWPGAGDEAGLARHDHQAVSFHRALRDIGATAELVVYPREPHGIAERAHQIDLLKRVRAWYDRWLRPSAGAET